MMLDQVKGIIATVAPAIATTLGGPLAGVAVRALSEAVLGKPDGSQQELAAAIQGASPETLAKIKEADQAFAVRMRELDIDVERIAANDRADARARQAATKDWVPAFLAFATLAGTFAYFGYLTWSGLDATPIVHLFGGFLISQSGKALDFFLGSSAGSKKKTEMLSQAATARAGQ